MSKSWFLLGDEKFKYSIVSEFISRGLQEGFWLLINWRFHYTDSLYLRSFYILEGIPWISSYVKIRFREFKTCSTSINSKRLLRCSVPDYPKKWTNLIQDINPLPGGIGTEFINVSLGSYLDILILNLLNWNSSYNCFRIPTVKLKIPGKSIFKIRNQNFCYIQVIVFDLSYLPAVAIGTKQLCYHEKMWKI